jgi:hypothetical protein
MPLIPSPTEHQVRTFRRYLSPTFAAFAAIVVLACEDSNGPAPLTGVMEVRVATAGAIEDIPNVFFLNVDYVDRPAVGANDVVKIGQLWRGKHVVYLDVAANCTVAGENPRWVEVLDDTGSSAVSFSVTCAAKPPSDSPWDF